MKHLIAALLLFAAPLAAADSITGKVVAVADGDTLTVLDAAKAQHRVRLYGIDAPEKAQAFGTKAKQALADMTFGKEVVVEVKDTDRYGRLVGKIKQGDTDINLRMVELGLAWWFFKYAPNDKAIRQAEAEAYKARRGLWADNDPTPPWEFRRKK